MPKKQNNKEQLKRKLGLLQVFCIATGAMISSGLFILPGIAHSKAGPAVFVSYLIAGLFAIAGMLSEAELVSAMPKAGGSYFYVNRAMGPAVGTANGLLTWFSLTMKSLLALIGMAHFAHAILPFDLNVSYIAIILCVVFVTLNILGIKKVAVFQVILVFGLLAILFLYIGNGMFQMELDLLKPFMPGGVAGVFATAGFVFISYGGLLKVSSIAEEIKQPGRTIPLGMILSVLVVMVLYMLVVLITAGLLEPAVLDKSLTPITDGAEASMGNVGKIVLSIAAIFAFISTANAGILAATRYPLALARDALIPRFLSKVNKKFDTPHVSIILTGIFMVVMLFLGLTSLVKVASTVLILTFILACLSIIVLRESKIQNYRPSFKAPLYPWVQIIGLGGFGFLLYQMGLKAIITTAIFFLAGFFTYWFYGRIKESREFALLHLIERITAKELTDYKLETELKEIIRERDDISTDRFDNVIEESKILDIEESLDYKELFKKVSEELSEKCNFDAESLYNTLISREEESSTIINPFTAIPHVVLPGKNEFEILPVRSREGIMFPDIEENVHAVFFLVGTKDERNFHLRSLSAIAQIIQEDEFEDRWMQAKSINSLRDAILLGKRRR